MEYLRLRNAPTLLYPAQSWSRRDATGSADGWAEASSPEAVMRMVAEWERVVVEDQFPAGATARCGRALVQWL